MADRWQAPGQGPGQGAWARLRWRVRASAPVGSPPAAYFGIVACSFLASWAIAGPVGTLTGPAFAVPLLVVLFCTFCLWWLPTLLRPKPSVLRQALAGVETDRLRLRPATPADAHALAATIDDLVVRNNGWVRAPSIEALGRSAGEAGRSASVAAVLITDRFTGAVLGQISCMPVPLPAHAPSCQLGWWIGPGARDQGYGTEAVSAAVNAIQQRGGAYFVGSGTSADNLPARRLLETTGAIEIAEAPVTLPNGTTIAGVWYVYPAPSITPTIPAPPPPPPPPGAVTWF